MPTVAIKQGVRIMIRRMGTLARPALVLKSERTGVPVLQVFQQAVHPDELRQTLATQARSLTTDGNRGRQSHAPTMVSPQSDLAHKAGLATRTFAGGQTDGGRLGVVRSHAGDDTIRPAVLPSVLTRRRPSKQG